MMNQKIEISAIIPVTEKNRYDDVEKLYQEYSEGLKAAKRTFEIIFVVDGDYPTVTEGILKLQNQGEKIKLIKLSREFGEATAISIGFDESHGEIILTLPAYLQVNGTEIPKIIAALNGVDMVIARRWPRKDSFLNRLQAYTFHKILKSLTGITFHDLGCSVRAMKRRVLEEVNLYGDQHRFLPLIADRYGFKIIEVNAQQSKNDTHIRFYSIGIYFRRILDLLSVFFLTKFTKKPLRFFGLSGLFIFIAGTILGAFLAIQRLFFGIGLADRPIVLVSLLLIVLGIQIFAIGLIGEIIIFTHARELKEYTVEQIYN